MAERGRPAAVAGAARAALTVVFVVGGAAGAAPPPPAAKSTAVKPSTSRPGSRDKAPPTATASMTWIAKAAATPSRTANGRNRVPSTSEANRLLSGSSARKMTANVVRMVGLTQGHSDAHPGGAT